MTRQACMAAALGAAAMVVGAFGAWATTQSATGARIEPGMEHGGVVVLVLGLAVAAFAAARLRTLVAIAALACLAWTALVMFELPGSLTVGGTFQADIAWGAYAVLAGSVLALIAAVAPGR